MAGTLECARVSVVSHPTQPDVAVSTDDGTSGSLGLCCARPDHKSLDISPGWCGPFRRHNPLDAYSRAGLVDLGRIGGGRGGDADRAVAPHPKSKAQGLLDILA